jgi:hypothetical protein
MAISPLSAKGDLIPLLVPIGPSLGPSLTNPSVLTDPNTNSVWVNLRNINYILYHSEHNNFEHPWGPIVYVHPENDIKLKTTNILCKMKRDLSGVEWHSVVDTSALDADPMWEFHGLEDGRLVAWGNKMYLCGVRRDTTPNGVGRMELSELVIDTHSHKVSEVSRYRIPIPGPDPNASYCEKNWVPILDRQYEFIKWSNPLEVVKVNPSGLPTRTIHSGRFMPGISHHDLRGGSQVIRVSTEQWGEVYMYIVHETDLFFTEKNRKNAVYTHRVLLLDPNSLDLLAKSDPFNFADARVEFCCGMATDPTDPSKVLITFGFQDNTAFMLKIALSEVLSLCN